MSEKRLTVRDIVTVAIMIALFLLFLLLLVWGRLLCRFYIYMVQQGLKCL